MKTGHGIHIENNNFSIEEFNLLKKEKVELSAKVSDLTIELLYYKHELAQLKRMIFGSKSERFVPATSGQLSLELNVEQESAPEQETESITYTRKKPKDPNKNVPVRLPLPGHLHREEHVIEPEEVTSGAKKIGEVVTEILEYTPGKFYVEKYIRPKYALPAEEGIIIGELPLFPIPRGNAGPGLLSHILISKFTDHLPFYRQAQQFKRQDITIAESTLNGWFSATCDLLEPLYDKLMQRVLQSWYLMVDETPIPVLTSLKPGSTHKGYFWVYYSPLDKLVYFDYRKGRSRDGPLKFMEGFRGTIQTDGYSAYNIFEKHEGITLLACMAHARRKFEKALDNDLERAEYALKKIQDLYQTERKARESKLSYDQRKELRQKEALPVLEELETWMKEQLPEVLPKSAIGNAITYTLRLWKRLPRYLEDGHYEIDNNLVENSIRPVALGRKNYLFAGSHEGAKRAAMIYSFLGTCKINNVEPFSWLKDVLTRIPGHSIQRLDELLPANWIKKSS